MTTEIKTLKQLKEFLSKWLKSDEENDPEIQIPVSVIYNYRNFCNEENYLDYLQNEVERLQKHIRNQKITLKEWEENE